MTQEQIQQEAERIFPIETITLKRRYENVVIDGNERERDIWINGAQFVIDRHAWVSVSDRLPTKEDAVETLGEWEVEIIETWMGHRHIEKIAWDMVKINNSGYWRTPLDNNFPQVESNDFYCKEYEANGYRCDEGQCEKCAKIDNG